jgi:hypothetical protein
MDEAADLAWSDGTYGTVSDVRIRAVAFDIGGVLKQVGRISDFEATWQERLGMTQAEFGQALASAPGTTSCATWGAAVWARSTSCGMWTRAAQQTDVAHWLVCARQASFILDTSYSPRVLPCCRGMCCHQTSSAKSSGLAEVKGAQ